MMVSEDKSLHWFVLNVKPFMEKKAAAGLESMGIEYYLPVQRTRRRWSDRYKVTDKLVIPRLLFIRTTHRDRLLPLKTLTYLRGYVTKRGTSVPIIIPDKQMSDFIFAVTNIDGDMSLNTSSFKKGDYVVIVSGPLRGLKCQLVEVHGKKVIAVDMSELGMLTFEIEKSLIEIVK